MRKLILMLVTVWVSSVALFMSSASADERIVDCESGDTIGEALDVKHVKFLEPIEIWFTGTCTENILIDRDDVVIFGEGDAELIGTIRVNDARRILLQYFKVTGPGIGIEVFGGHVELRSVNVTSNGSYGIAANRNSFVAMYDSNITNNASDGIHVIVGSTAEIHKTDILNNTGSGIEIDRHSTADIRDGCKINGNENGVRMWLHSSAFITDTEINSNRSDGIWMDSDSGVVALPPVDITGNIGFGVNCVDVESSFKAFAPITDPINCTDFSF